MAARDKIAPHWWILFILNIILLCACQRPVRPQPPEPAPAHIQQEYGILQALYGQFKVFRKDPLFLRHGFSANSPHAPWLQVVQDLRTQPALAQGAALLADLATSTRIHGEESQTAKNFETHFLQFLTGQPAPETTDIAAASPATTTPSAPATVEASPPGPSIQIVFSGDTQGVLLPQPGPHGPVGGLQRRLVAMAKLRIQEPEAVLLDAGDMFSPTSKTARSSGQTLIQTMNQMGCRAAGLGPHDMALGAASLNALAKEATFPFLCANVRPATPFDWLKPYTLIHAKNCTIAVTSILPQPSQPLNGMEFIPTRTVLKALLPELRKQADYIVLLTQCDTEEIRSLADDLEDVDVILGDYRQGKRLPRYVHAMPKGQGLGLVTLSKAAYRSFGLEQHRTLILDGTATW